MCFSFLGFSLFLWFFIVCFITHLCLVFLISLSLYLSPGFCSVHCLISSHLTSRSAHVFDSCLSTLGFFCFCLITQLPAIRSSTFILCSFQLRVTLGCSGCC